jgi:hypothetical protein
MSELNDKQMSSQQKYVKKLEKEIASLRKDANSVSIHGPQIRVLENKDLGEHVVAVLGKAGTEDAHVLVIHRLIGTDPSIPKEGSWCISNAGDIPGFLETRDHPGAKKIKANINQHKADYAISLNLLEKDSGGLLVYPGTKDNQSKILDEARDLRSLYVSSKGIKTVDAPGVEFFMDADNASAELKYKIGLLECGEYRLAVESLYKDLASHRPHTLTMSYQRMAPYLYGMEVSQVLGALYLHLAGLPNPSKNEIPKTFAVLEESYPSLQATFASKKDLERLEEALGEFKTANKQYNLAVSEEKKQKKDSTKEQKKVLSEEVTSTRDALASAKKNVMSADIDFGKHTKPGKDVLVSAHTGTGTLIFPDYGTCIAEEKKESPPSTAKTKGKANVAAP